MKVIARNIRYIAFCILATGIISLAAYPAQAQTATDNVEAGAPMSGTGCDQHFLTFPAWYNGLTVQSGDGCDIRSPADVGGFSPFIWRVALNLVEILLNLAGYAAVGFIIYGGYKYMISAGSSDGMMAARKTILNAVVGLVISIAAIAIVNTISGSFGIGG